MSGLYHPIHTVAMLPLISITGRRDSSYTEKDQNIPNQLGCVSKRYTILRYTEYYTACVNYNMWADDRT